MSRSGVEGVNFGDMFHQAADRMLSGETVHREQLGSFKQEPLLFNDQVYLDENVDDLDGGELPTNEEFQSVESYLKFSRHGAAHAQVH